MNPSPYQPPIESENAVASDPDKTSPQLARIGLATAVGALVSPLIIVAFVLLGVLSVRWDSIFTPVLVLAVSLPQSIAGIGICVAARWRHSSWKAVIGMWVALAAIPWSIAVAWLLAMAGLATHPV